jgi:replicative DNA helicase
MATEGVDRNRTSSSSSLEERLAPQNLDAERAVLGSVMLESSLFNQISHIVKAEDFFLDSHRKIYRSFALISEKKSSGAIDLVTIKDALNQIASVEEVGGTAYLSSLIDGLPRYSNIENYARIVKDKSVLRKLIHASHKIINESYSSRRDVAEVLEEAQSSVFQIAEEGYSTAGFRPIEDLGLGTLEKLAKMVEAHTGITGLPTGFMNYDDITAGLQPGDLVILAARPGMGKTSFALNIAMNVAKRDYTVGFFSLEMDINQLFLRMICSEARVNSQKIRTGRISQSDFDKLAAKLDEVMKVKIFIDDAPLLGVMEARSKARRLKSEYGLDVLFVDYLQLMSVPPGAENRNLAIGEITRGMKALAKELHVPVVVLSQLSRAPEQRSDHRPQLADLRESGNIEQDADLVCFLYREEYYNPTDENSGRAELIIAKNRNGPVGTASLVFLSDITIFQDYTPPIEEEI